jgi:outer membrane protein TolC
MRFRILAFLLATAGSAAHAQLLSLEDAVRLTLGQNPEVRAHAFKADAADARARQAKGHRYPSIDLYETYSKTDNPAEVFALTLNQGRFDMNEFFMADPNKPEAIDSFVTRLEVTQPVYTGGKLNARISQAQAMSSAQRLEADHVREKAVFDTTSAYFNVVKARESLALLENARSTTLSHVELAEAYARQGFIMEAEVLKAKVHLAEVDELVARAKSGVHLARAALNFQMGENQDREWQLEPLEPPKPILGSLEAWLDAALQNRRDLESGRRKLEAGRLEERVARSGYLPEVAVIGRFDLYDDSLLGSNGSSGSLMAVAKINLFRGGSDAAAREVASNQVQAFEHDIKRFEEGVRLETRRAWQELDTARARHSAAVGALDSAREALRVSEHRFKQELDRMIDLLDAETALREAELRELVARYDVALGTRRLHFVAGTPLFEGMEESR